MISRSIQDSFKNGRRIYTRCLSSIFLVLLYCERSMSIIHEKFQFPNVLKAIYYMNGLVCDLVHGMLSKVQKIFRGKAVKFAQNKKDEGEHWLRKGKLERALASANLAVVRAPVKGLNNAEDLKVAPLSLWIRSEILFEMSEYKLSLNDIQLSLKYHLPNHLKAKAYQRMGMCYLNLGDKKKASLSLNIARSCGNNTIQEECNKVLEDIEKLLKSPQEIKKPHSLPSPSSHLPGLTTSVELSSDANCGRFVKTTMPISIGEIVSCEEPYVSALFIEKHGTHCLHCYSRLKAPIPCPDCSGVGFCSSECLTEGMKYHQWECPYLELHIGSGMSILSHLSLRIITQKSLDYFKKEKRKNNEYEKVMKLEGHSKERDGKDLFRRTLMALFLLQSLRQNGYFKRSGNDSQLIKGEENDIDMPSDEEINIGCLLLHHLQVLQYNTHEIYETVLPKDSQCRPGSTLYVALGLYLNTAMLNHQCQPTLARYFQGRKIILRAQRPIKVGEEVSENYGPIFTMRTKDQRQKILSGRYLFSCTCDACVFDWPLLTKMAPETVLFRCNQDDCPGAVAKSGICQKCGQKQPVKNDIILFQTYQNNWSNASELLKIGRFSEAEKIILQYLNDMWKLAAQPNKNLCLAMEALRTIWASTSGNVSLLPIPVKT